MLSVLNHRNDQYIAKAHSEIKGILRTKHPAQVKGFGVMVSDEKKLSTEVYYKVLKTNYFASNYVWTHDGAPSHAVKKVQKFGNENFKDIWPTNVWLLSIPDLNPFDYAFYSTLEHSTNST